PLDLRDDFVDQGVTKLLEVALAKAGVVKRCKALGNDLRRAVAERHYDNHGLGLALGNQVVEDHVCATDGGPGARVIAETVQKVERGVKFLGFRIVGGGSINVKVPIIAHDPRPVEMVVDDAVWNVIDLPRQGGRSGHVHGTLGVKQVGFHQVVRGVDQADPIGLKRVTVEIRVQRIGSDTPNTLLVFLHGQRLCTLAGKQDLLSIGSAEAESNTMVRVYLWRNQRRRGLRPLRRLSPSENHRRYEA